VIEEPPRIEALGDSALLVTFGDRIDRGLNRRARGLAEAVEALRAPGDGLGRPVPAFASVLVPFDPLAIEADVARAMVTRLLENSADAERAAPADAPRLVELPVRYGGADGPDLADVAALHGIEPADVIEAHSSVEYEVFFLGFAPGFAYLGTLPESIATPRLPEPRVRVPAGSVGIAGSQTGVYPFELPGGWRIIGRTDAVLWDIRRDSPALLRPGDRVRFVPVSRP
jgi:KipI family sensor histidine kinase inhibitor